MKKRGFLAMGFMVLVVFFISVSTWAVPQLINYQGKLTDDLGNPLNGSYSMHFMLFEVETGGDAIWLEQQIVFVTDGIYNVQLGSVEPFPEGLFEKEELYLQVYVSREPLFPRQRLVSTAYSMKAGDAEALDGLDSSDFLTSTQPGSMTAEALWAVLSVTNTSPGGPDWGDAILGLAVGSGSGVRGGASGSNGRGVYGSAVGSGGIGVYGRALDTGDVKNYGGDFSADGIYGVGVHGGASGSNGTGVYGYASNTGDVENYGGYFEAWGKYGYGVYGLASNTGDVENYGGYFEAKGKYGMGVRGEANSVGVRGMATKTGDVTNYGGYFEAAGTYGEGVYGRHNLSGNDGRIGSAWEGVRGYSPAGGRGAIGVSEAGEGVHGVNNGTGNKGILGGPWYGVYGEGGSAGSYAGAFKGNVIIISKTTGTTVIELGEGLDYAEGFNVSERTKVVAGSVLIIDPDNSGKLTLSNKPYDSKVAGIVTGAKGMGSGVRLGSDKFDYDVALAGRVYCNVDASYGKVSPGDLLTTSDTPGYAMKVSDYTKAQGAILGKAMGKLEKGEKGQILVLVTLQ